MKPVRMGMVGGGEGAFIGAVHRIAARLDGEIELVCGAFSRDAENCRRTGEALNVAPARAYTSYQAMMETEAALPFAERMEFVAVVTPNHLHVPVAVSALSHGFHVLSDKPAALDLAEALALQAAVERSGRLYALTHTYLGYPMVKEARALVAAGELGTLRRITVEYPQGWLAGRTEDSGSKQAAWRTDPALSGIAGCLSDIGTHASTLAEYIAGEKITEVSAEVGALVDGRRLDDDAAVLFRTAGGTRGSLMATQVCSGEENGLWIRVAGDRGTLHWRQMWPNELTLKRQGEPVRIYQAGEGYLSAEARRLCRTPPGHPEGYLEAFANIYTAFARAVRSGDGAPLAPYGIEVGVQGMLFVAAALANAAGDEKWTSLDRVLAHARTKGEGKA